jgi:hypothetical protein
MGTTESIGRGEWLSGSAEAVHPERELRSGAG